MFDANICTINISVKNDGHDSNAYEFLYACIVCIQYSVNSLTK